MTRSVADRSFRRGSRRSRAAARAEQSRNDGKSSAFLPLAAHRTGHCSAKQRRSPAGPFTKALNYRAPPALLWTGAVQEPRLRLAILMTGRGSGNCGSWLLCAAASAALCAGSRLRPITGSAAAAANANTPAWEPRSRMRPLLLLPDLGVGWPQTQRSGNRRQPPHLGSPRRNRPAKSKKSKTTEATGHLSAAHGPGRRAPRHLEALKTCSRRFGHIDARGRAQEPANAAQIGRRASADADLLNAVAPKPRIL